jgi:hypothetical protein
MARLDRSAAQQHLLIPNGDRTNDHLGVAVMDDSAGIANGARTSVIGGNPQLDGGATIGTELHGQHRSLELAV